MKDIRYVNTKKCNATIALWFSRLEWFYQATKTYLYKIKGYINIDNTGIRYFLGEWEAKRN